MVVNLRRVPHHRFGLSSETVLQHNTACPFMQHDGVGPRGWGCAGDVSEGGQGGPQGEGGFGWDPPMAIHRPVDGFRRLPPGG